MSKKWVVLNAGLLLVAALLSWHLRESIADFNTQNDVARIQPGRDLRRGAPDAPLPAPKPHSRYDPAEFQVIANQNLFSETRAKEEKTEVVAVQEIPPMTVRPVLVGITAVGSQRMALIVDPSAPPGRRKMGTKRLGDTYQGYTITDITENRMVLESANRREVIPLFDGSKRPAQGGKTPVAATRVVAFSVGQAGGGGAAVIQTQRPAASIQTSARQVAAQQTQAAASSAQAAPQSGIVRSTPQGRQVPGASQGATWNQTVDDQGRTVIRTPFGDIVRDRPPNR